VAVVVCTHAPLVPVMVSVGLPTGVDVLVAMVSTVVPEFVSEEGVNNAVAPDGNPLVTEKIIVPVKLFSAVAEIE